MRGRLLVGLSLLSGVAYTQSGGFGENAIIIEPAEYGARWSPVTPQYSGIYTFYDWKKTKQGPTQWIHTEEWGHESGYDYASNASGTSQEVKMTGSGTVKLGLRWIGQGAPPPYVWLKVGSSSLYTGTPVPASGFAFNGLGDEEFYG